MLFFAAALALMPQLPTPRAATRAAPPMMRVDREPPQQQLQRTALAALAAAVLVAAPMDAEAARSGGRMGGRAPAMRSAPMRSAPMRGGGGYGGGYGGGRTNVIISPGIGMGMSPFGYGYGYGISPGAYLGLTLAETLLREQQRQAYLEQQLRTQQQLGQDQAMIQQLQTALAEQSAKVEGLRAQGGGGGGAAAAAPALTADQAQIERLTRELAEQKAALQKLQTAQ